MVSDIHLLKTCIWYVVNNYNYIMQVDRSRQIFNQNIDFIYAVNMIYSKYRLYRNESISMNLKLLFSRGVDLPLDLPELSQ